MRWPTLPSWPEHGTWTSRPPGGRRWGWRDRYAGGPRGCSSMVEPPLPKLMTGVRFSSPAPPHPVRTGEPESHGRLDVQRLVGFGHPVTSTSTSAGTSAGVAKGTGVARSTTAPRRPRVPVDSTSASNPGYISRAAGGSRGVVGIASHGCPRPHRRAIPDRPRVAACRRSSKVIRSVRVGNPC